MKIRNLRQLNKIKKENNDLTKIINSFKDKLSILQNESDKIEVINPKSFRNKKKAIRKISRINSQLNHYQSKFTKNEYAMYEYSLFNDETKQIDADRLYHFICYVESKNVDNKIFPYKLSLIRKLNRYLRKQLFCTNKLYWLRDICLKSRIINHQSTYSIKKHIKKNNKKLINITNDIENIKISFANRYHAWLVAKLAKSKKDIQFKQNQKNIAIKQLAKKKKLIEQINLLHKKCHTLKNKRDKNLADNKKAYCTSKIDKNEYLINKSKLLDDYYDQKDVIKNEIIRFKDEYKNFSEFDEHEEAVILKNVVKYYNNKVLATKVLSNINLKIKKGEFVVILGPSGCGKTTLLNIISGMDNATYGDTIIAGENLIDYNQGKLTTFRRNNIGYVFQQYGLLPNLTVRENIEIGQNLQHQKSRIIPIDEILKSIDLNTQANKYPNELSGGQQQRVSIARSIAKNPNILFGDEPTGAIDEQMSKNILNLFVDINRKYKTTIIIVTHNPILADLATMVINISNGTIKDIKYNSNPKTVAQLNWTNK